jgi:diguanylate cyclase (GGDEF)-like protein/PAS domain S-box-containing protein
MGKLKLAAELLIANKELAFQNSEKADRAAELLIANKELDLASAIFALQVGMIVTDAETKIIRVNDAFISITGYTAEEAIGQTPRLLSSGRQDKSFYEAMWQSLTEKGAWEGEIWNRRKSGDIYPENLNITEVRDAQGVLTNYVAMLTDVSSSKTASEEIRNLAFYDPLTHLPNRRLLLDRLKQVLLSNTRSGKRGALLFMDLDHFKNLNDTLGHRIGDLLLQQVSERLTSSVRGSDTVARIGGDEFVILLPELSEDTIECASQTQEIVDKIMLAINQPYQLEAHNYSITASIGIALIDGKIMTIETLLERADIAMYQAKSGGRNAMRFFEKSMQEKIAQHVNLEREMRQAIEQNQFELYFQVQVDVNNQPLGAEALVRWMHPTRGIILPSQFIPIAEQSGLVIPIGQCVLDVACNQLKAWEKKPRMRDFTLAVNISAKQFRIKDFVDQVKACVKKHGINPALLKLELTESALIDDIETLILHMHTLKDMGVRFELDDFGTGYSSLQYLKKLPIEQLKIAQSFVRDIEQDENDRQIVNTIIAMAKTLKLSVIAEGVETEGQRKILQDNGCMRFQGFLFGKPMPISEFERSLFSLPFFHDKTQVTSEIGDGIVAKYNVAIKAYNALCSDENYKYLDEVYKEYKDFLASNK